MLYKTTLEWGREHRTNIAMSMFQSSLECAKDGFITIIGILVISPPASRFSGEELKARLLSDT